MKSFHAALLLIALFSALACDAAIARPSHGAIDFAAFLEDAAHAAPSAAGTPRGAPSD